MRHRLQILAAIIVCGCARQHERITFDQPLRTDTTIKYARRFCSAKDSTLTLFYVLGDRRNGDTTAVFALSPDTARFRSLPGDYIKVKTPCERIASLGSVYSAMLSVTGAADRIIAIDNIDYVNDTAVVARFKSGLITELQKEPAIDVEKALAARPDIVFTFGMGLGAADVDDRAKRAGLKMVVSVDHLERTPLGRAEWIKFFAEFAGKRRQADELFDRTRHRYDSLKNAAGAQKNRPSVFSEMKVGGAWYLPGGNSNMATLMRDAGADYVWKTDTNFGSLMLSFEEVLSKARDAEYWINLPMVSSRKELLGHEQRYGAFRAFRTGNVFNNTLHVNTKGYSTYWETGMIYPDRVLNDLIRIFNGNDTAGLYYYRRLP